MLPRETLLAFDSYLAARSLRLDGVVIGGAALNLLGVVSWPSKDCDILQPQLPPEILAAARTFAAGMRERGAALDDDWLSNGPASLALQLPTKWEERVQRAFAGAAIRLDCLGRLDFLRAKLLALCDHQAPGTSRATGLLANL
jgi:hypothetical protein